MECVSGMVFTNPVTYVMYYRMAGNIGVELYLAVGEMKPVSPNFNPPTLNQPIFAYSILSPNIIPANISSHTVFSKSHNCSRNNIQTWPDSIYRFPIGITQTTFRGWQHGKFLTTNKSIVII